MNTDFSSFIALTRRCHSSSRGMGFVLVWKSAIFPLTSIWRGPSYVCVFMLRAIAFCFVLWENILFCSKKDIDPKIWFFSIKASWKLNFPFPLSLSPSLHKSFSFSFQLVPDQKGIRKFATLVEFSKKAGISSLAIRQDLARNTELATLPIQTFLLPSLCFSPSGNLLFSLSRHKTMMMHYNFTFL